MTEVGTTPWLVRQLRIMASRGKVDDADVQVLFDAADRLDLYDKKIIRLMREVLNP